MGVERSPDGSDLRRRSADNQTPGSRRQSFLSQPPQTCARSPVNNKCAKCDKAVKKDGEPCCDGCNRWFHAKCLDRSLVGIDIGFLKFAFVKVFCTKCIKKDAGLNVTGSRFDVTSIVTESSSQTESVGCDAKSCQTTVVEVNLTVDEPVVVGSEVERESVAAVVKSVIVKGHHNVLSNMYDFPFLFDNEQFRSSEHCFQVKRARKRNAHDLAEKIKAAPTAYVAKRLYKRLRGTGTDREWDKNLMKEILDQKADQLPSFLDALVKSGESRLVHSTYPDDGFWGSVLYSYDQQGAEMKDLPGQNVFGQLLMDVRKNLLRRAVTSNAPCQSYATVAARNIPRRTDTAPVRSCFSQQNRGQRPTLDSPNKHHRCFHCGVPGHVVESCRLKGAPVQCFECKQYGHKRRYCSFFRSLQLQATQNSFNCAVGNGRDVNHYGTPAYPMTNSGFGTGAPPRPNFLPVMSRRP